MWQTLKGILQGDRERKRASAQSGVNGKCRQRRKKWGATKTEARTIGARALCTTVSEYLLLPDPSVRPSVRRRYCLFKFRVRVCGRARRARAFLPPRSSSRFISFAVESLEGPDLSLRRLTRADMGAYLVPHPMACRLLQKFLYFFGELEIRCWTTRQGSTSRPLARMKYL